MTAMNTSTETARCPPLRWRRSPNVSDRGLTPRLVVMHCTEGGYQPSVDWLCNPSAQASAHIVIRDDGGEATQLVEWHRKAWHVRNCNSIAYGVEMTGHLDHLDPRVVIAGARVCAWLCHHYRIPPVVAQNPCTDHGFTRHRDLACCGNDHDDPLTGSRWDAFVAEVRRQTERGKFGLTYGRA